MATALDIITDALTDLSVLADGETPSAALSSHALRTLNRLLNQYGSERLTMHSETRTETAIVASQASYTVGSGGNINITRPADFLDVRYQDTSTTPDTEYPLHKLTDQEYRAEAFKDDTQTIPEAWYYNPTYPTGTLYLLPIPTGTTLQVVTYHRAPVSEFAATSTSVSLPPGWERALVKNLALELSPSFGRPPAPLLVFQARESLAAVKRANRRIVEMSYPADAMLNRAGLYDITRE